MLNRLTRKQARVGQGARNQKGSAIIEFGVSLPIIIVAVCLALNLGVTLLSVRAADLAARDAARAASLQQTRDDALNAARAAVKTHAFAGQAPVVDENTFVFETYNNGQPVPETNPGPHVMLTVKANASLPFKGMFYGVGFETEALDIKRTYTYPIMKLRHISPGPVAGKPGPVAS